MKSETGINPQNSRFVKLFFLLRLEKNWIVSDAIRKWTWRFPGQSILVSSSLFLSILRFIFHLFLLKNKVKATKWTEMKAEGPFFITVKLCNFHLEFPHKTDVIHIKTLYPVHRCGFSFDLYHFLLTSRYFSETLFGLSDPVWLQRSWIMNNLLESI